VGLKTTKNAMDSVTVHVPATTANLGPGFDCLGMALDIFNTVAVRQSHTFSLAIEGEGQDTLPHNEDNLVYRSLCAVYAEVGAQVPPLSIWCQNVIPLARGLGSSAAAIVGGITAANLLLGEPLSPAQVAKLAAKLEGHPDNTTPAVYGGCQVVVNAEGEIVHAAIPLPAELQMVLFIPNLTTATEMARAILPPVVSRTDAVFNLGRVALLVDALVTGRLELLKIATQDRLHQPARKVLFPLQDEIFAAALGAGAWGAFLSGAGPTILALATEQASAVAEAMMQVARRAAISAETRITSLSPRGARATNP